MSSRGGGLERLPTVARTVPLRRASLCVTRLSQPKLRTTPVLGRDRLEGAAPRMPS